MDNICFIQTILDFTCFNIINSLCNIHCNRTGFWVWHQAFWSEDTSQTTNYAHHVRCCYYNVKIEPSLILDSWNEFFATNEICTCCFCFCHFITFSEYKNTNCFTSTVRQNNGTTYLLVSMTAIYTKTDMSFYGFIKFCNCCFLNKANCFSHIILCCTIY